MFLQPERSKSRRWSLLYRPASQMPYEHYNNFMGCLTLVARMNRRRRTHTIFQSGWNNISGRELDRKITHLARSKDSSFTSTNGQLKWRLPEKMQLTTPRHPVTSSEIIHFCCSSSLTLERKGSRWYVMPKTWTFIIGSEKSGPNPNVCTRTGKTKQQNWTQAIKTPFTSTRDGKCSARPLVLMDGNEEKI
jgi:hypothetical protein